MTIFLSGGCKNGKSTLAQTLAIRLAGGGPLWYVATMIPGDEEDENRIRAHIQNRKGLGFRTLEAGTITGRETGTRTGTGKETGTGRRTETGTGITSLAERTGGRGVYLLDSVTALLANEMFPKTGEPDSSAPLRVTEGLLRFIRSVEHAVLVSDWIYGGAGPYGQWTEYYRVGLAAIDRTLAEHCDAVAEVSAGIPFWHKGAPP